MTEWCAWKSVNFFTSSTFSPSFSFFPFIHTHTHTYTHSLYLSVSLSHSHTFSLYISFSLTLTSTLSLSHSHSHTLSLFLSLFIFISLTYVTKKWRKWQSACHCYYFPFLINIIPAPTPSLDANHWSVTESSNKKRE